MMPAAAPFLPPRLLRSPHVQTVLGSRARKPWVERRAADLIRASKRELITTSDGVRLEAWVARRQQGAPSVILIHGWLGHAGSSYVLSAGAELWARGFSVLRLNLRDHGNTADLNEEIYHAARLTEVVDVVSILRQQHATGPTGLAGFSLGGNFALRVARDVDVPVLAVCPALNPAATLRRIDYGWVGYRVFFVSKWRTALRQKQAAFPDRYCFDQALTLSSVAALTDLFVREHTPFDSTSAYLDAYSLTGDALRGTRATIVYAMDDPVIPPRDFQGLPASIESMATRHGGHCAFLYSPSQPGWIDRLIADHFAKMLMPAPPATGHAGAPPPSR